MKINSIKVWNFDLPPFPREGLFHLDMSEHCQVTRLLKHESSILAHVNQFDVITDSEDLKKFQKALRRKLWKIFGVSYDPALPLDVRSFGKIQKEGYSIEKLIFQSRPGLYVTALLYVPEGKGPFPAVLQMHGHNPEGKFGINVQQTSMALVKEGFVCLAVDAIGTFERAWHCYETEYHGGVLGGHLLNVGETLMGTQVVDNLRAVDLLRQLECVKKDKIGATGASGGGNQTMWLAAMDERIAAAMPVVSVGSFQSYVYGMNCMCELLPDGLTFTEISGILALIAPRHLRVANALYDCNHDFSVAEMLKSYHPVERVYGALGLSERISFYIADRVHGYTDRQRESAIGFFNYALKDEGNGNARPIVDEEPLPIDDLKLFPSPGSRPAEILALQDICQKKGEELRKAMLEKKSFSAAAERKALGKLFRLRQLPSQMQLNSYAAVSGVKRYALRVGDHLIPFLYKEGSSPEKVRILLHPEGKGQLSPETISAAAADGASLLMPDLFGTGETCQQAPCGGLHHQFFRQLLWIGRSLMGEWIFDINALVKTAVRNFKAKELSLWGVKECGVAAAAVNALEKGLSGVTLEDAPVSMLFDSRTVSNFRSNAFAKFLPNAIYTIAMSQPGFLCWGDISLMESLNYSQVHWITPRSSDGTPLSQEEFAAHEGEVNTLRKKISF